ncbi:MAG TPA: hypothetical protein VEA69_13745 [Tepidisphaeraceae bacterium]|nr:hypothetical protein [Tepidisphaeraceae bacterium]
MLIGGGYDAEPDDFARQFAVLRLNANGTPDATFGDGGIGVVGGSGYWGDTPAAMALQPDGRIVLAGTHSVYMGSSYVVSRMTAGGRPDTSFGTGGYTVLNRGASYPMDFGMKPDGAAFVAVAPDGTIVVAGYNDMPTEEAGGPHPFSNDFGVFRLLPSGELDWSFGDRGWTFVPFGAHDSPGGGFIKDSKLTLVGMGQPASTASDVALARLSLVDAAPITAAVSNGVLRITGSASAETIRLVREGSRIRVTGVAGSFAAGSFSRIEIAGLGGNDTIDSSTATVPVTIDAGAGNDFVLGGAANDTIFGGDGHDTLFGGNGGDSLSGGNGDDYLNAGPGADTVLGGAGNDQVLATDAAADVIDLGPGFDRFRADAIDSVLGAEAPLLV